MHAGDSQTYTDKRTGLVWQNDKAIGVVKKTWMDMTAVSARKCFYGVDQDSCSDTSGDTATTYCENLQLSGFDDWRLPSVEELGSFVQDEFSQWKLPIVEATKEPNRQIRQGTFWSATSAQYKGKPREAAYSVLYVVVEGERPEINIFTRDKNNELYVRCVRGEITGSSSVQRRTWNMMSIPE